MHAHIHPAAVTTSALTAMTLRGLDELEALGAAWNRLAGEHAEPMQRHAWSLAAAHALHAGARLCVITIRRGAALAAVAPLVEVRRGNVRTLEILGARRLGEPVSFPCDAPDARAALCRAMLAQRLPLMLQRLDSVVWSRELKSQARGRALLSVLPGSRCVRVDFTGDWPQYQARLSTGLAATLRRRRRQLARLGKVSFDFRQPAPQEVEEQLREAFEVERHSWKGEAGSAVLQQPAMFEFFERLAKAAAATGHLGIRRLRVDDQLVAVHVGLLQAGRWWELKIGYDARWARCSPGLQLTVEALEDGFRRGLRAHEFLGSAADWQAPFATSDRRLETVLAYPLSATGMFSLATDVGGIALRRVTRGARASRNLVAQLTRPFAQAARHRVASLRAKWFDWRQGVETSARAEVAELTDIEARLARHAVHYEATSIEKFERALRILGERVHGFTFIDLGSGKGRVLMLAALRRFRRVIGVEVSAALHEAAQRNTATFASRNRNAAPIECICADASVHELPAGDLLVFLYNPFDAELLALAREQMLAACRTSPRRLAVVYINPLHHALFEQDRTFICEHRDAAIAVYWLREVSPSCAA